MKSRIDPMRQRHKIKAIVVAFGLLTSVISGCSLQTESDKEVIPNGFKMELLEILRCPENLTRLRFAKRSEIRKVNDEIRKGLQKRWDGKKLEKPVEALLIREDGKIRYEVEKGVPVIIIGQAIVLDSSVGLPDPDNHRIGKG